jgi:hypothetical protein
VSRIEMNLAETIEDTVELDSHANTCCASANCVVIEYTEKVCNVVELNCDSPNDELIGIPIIKAATAYDALTGETFIVVLSQALIHLGNYLSYSLICPNQLHHNGLIVDDVPRHLARTPQVQLTPCICQRRMFKSHSRCVT